MKAILIVSTHFLGSIMIKTVKFTLFIVSLCFGSSAFAQWHTAKIERIQCYTQQWAICTILLDRTITHSTPGGSETNNEFMVRSPTSDGLGGNVVKFATMSANLNEEIEILIAQGQQFGLWEVFAIRFKNSQN